ncbi:MAG: hypothetical protein V4627_20260 [Pseudomonadota bacterium]
MNDLKKSKNYAVAKGPVNRRTSASAPEAKPVVAQAVLQRVSMAHAKRRLGTPLSQRLTASADAASHGKLPTATAIVQAIGGTVCAMGVGLGVIQSSGLVTSSSALALGAVGIWAAVSRRSQRGDGAAQPRVTATDLADPEALARLDAVMEKMAAQAPQATVDSLARLKESIVRCMALVSASAEEGSLATEESLYLREAVRRYIPDSINSCLQVPQKDRATLVIDGSKPALDLLHDQLLMIQQQLDTREAKLTQIAGEALLRQQRFLASKANSH